MQIFHTPLISALVTACIVFPPAKVLWLLSHFRSFNGQHFRQLPAGRRFPVCFLFVKALRRWIVAILSLFTEERIQWQPETMFATSEMQITMTKSSERSLHTGVPRRRLNVQKPRERNPEASGRRSETSGFLVTDRSVWENSAADENIPESTSAHFSSKHSIKKTAEPDGEGVKRAQSQTCARTEEWTCTICRGEIIHERGGTKQVASTETSHLLWRCHLKKSKYSSCSPFCWSH